MTPIELILLLFFAIDWRWRVFLLNMLGAFIGRLIG